MKRSHILAPIVGAGIAAASAAAAYVWLVRPWHLRWGASDEEVLRPLPGDELVHQPRIRATHAVTVQASPDQVWPWIVQIGQGRGGFYSYDWLENMGGLEIHSADQILTEFQHLEVGDIVPLEPGGFGPEVAAIQAPEYLVLGGRQDANSANPLPGMEPNPDAFVELSWTFFLESLDGNRTRLIERTQYNWNRSLVNTIFFQLILEPGSFIMQRKMLLGIKTRAETQVAAGAGR